MIYRPIFRLVLSSLERPEDSARAYAVIVDPSSDASSGIYLDGLPWDSEFFSGEDGSPPFHVPGSLGLVSLKTQETMQNHSASVSLVLGEVGSALRKRVLPQDPLRIEFLDPATGRWACGFDGFLTNVQWSRQSSPGSYHWRMDLAGQGLQKLLSEQWLDWQSMIRAVDNKSMVGSKGFGFYKELDNLKGDVPVSELMRIFIRGAVDEFLEIGVRGTRVGSGRTFQVSPRKRDWQTYRDLAVLPTQQWYLMQRGPIWGLLAGLSEGDVHEFFITYDQDPNSLDEFREIPTIVFRPRPWPGPPGSAVTAKDAEKVDDNSLWPNLNVVFAGLYGVPAAISVGTSRNDSARANSFFISLSGASDGSAHDLLADKVVLGYRVDENLVKRYGFSSRQVSCGRQYQRPEVYFETILPAILDRVAWQEAPLPFLLDQTRTFPLMPGVHVGSVLQDHSESLEAPTTGYIISVAHSLTGSPKGLHASTTIGTTRAIEGVDAEGYPAAVRKLVNLKKVSFLSPAETEAAMNSFRANTHSQPSPVAPQPGADDLFVSNHPELQDRNPGPGIAANLAHLQKFGIDWVRDTVGAIIITSVYRSRALNDRVSKNRNSDHLKGLAFDFQVPGGELELMVAWNKIRAAKGLLLFKDCILETRPEDGVQWIHYSVYPPGGAGGNNAGFAKTGD